MPYNAVFDHDEDISLVISRVKDRVGIDFSQYRETTLRRRINRRLVMRNCADLSTYIRLLDSDANEYKLLLGDLTIKYSEFFRDSAVFQAIAENVLPELVSGIKTYPGKLSIWSAGCATGEEACSLAIVARRLMQSGHIDLAVNIIGTDIDPDALETARCGSYRKDLLPVPVPEWAMPYFVDDGKNIKSVDEIRGMLDFRQQDLLSPQAVETMRRTVPGGFDLVLCRNVLIYLNRPAQLQVLATCCEMLKPGGFLIVGNREIVPKNMGNIVEPYKMEDRVYRKRKQ